MVVSPVIPPFEEEVPVSVKSRLAAMLEEAEYSDEEEEFSGEVESGDE